MRLYAIEGFDCAGRYINTLAVPRASRSHRASIREAKAWLRRRGAVSFEHYKSGLRCAAYLIAR